MVSRTGIGAGIGIPFKNNALKGDKPYLPPEIKDSLKAVVIAYGKTNNDSDRAIVKNLVDPDNPFVISNAAFKLNSGFGKYEVDFTEYRSGNLIYVSRILPNSILATTDGPGEKALLAKFPSNENDDINDYKVEIKLTEGVQVVYKYIDNTGTLKRKYLNTSGIYDLPKSYISKLPSEFNDSIGFSASGVGEIYLSQIPSFEGAFVTDGIDDLITSTKSATEMLDGSNEITVVSMIHQIKTNSDVTRNNWFFTPVSYLENRVVENKTGKTGIYGYTSTNVTNAQISDITPILGDKNDYTLYSKIEDGDRDYFTVEGFQNQGIWYVSSIAWYWTIIANKVLTTDEINQVIAYFNLDKTLKPDILCNITKQGITNDNHAEFNDKLIDYSGNGRDIQMNNLAWKGGSGIAAKPFETIKDYTIVSDEARQKLTIYNEFSYKVKSNTPNHYWTVQSIIKDNTSYQVTIITDKDCYWINMTSFTNNEGNKESIRKEYPVKANTPTQVTICGLNEFEYPEGIEPTTAVSYVNLNYAGEVTVTFIPSCKGGLLLDGVNDYGKVTGLPIYKDYTVVADREIETINGGVLSKSYVADNGSFIFEQYHLEQDSTSSFGYTKLPIDNLNRDRKISYQSKYSYNGTSLSVGTGIDGSNMWLATIRDNDSRFSNIAIYSLMSFPYSMSEFLIERQLKKHKLGTLYPDMVEFRPVIKANANYKITYYQIDSTNTWKSIKVGDYIVIGAKLAFQITFDNDASELKEVVSPQLSGIIVEKRPSNPGYNIYSYITSKSPQKINITIDEYIRYEDIVQPYPVLLRFNDENGNEVSWGGKFRVGSTITRIGSIADPESNLLNGLYSVSGLSLNGKAVTSSTSIVEKQMVFKTTATWLLDNNTPKCILSPSRLRIPNSSYKILGYIPDISGHGNHGVIHNSAYAGTSGANGYPYDYNNSSFWCDSILAKVVSGELVEYFAVKNSTGFSNITSGVYKGEIKVTGVTKAISENKISRLRIYTNSTTDNELIDITQDGNYNIDIKGVGDANRVFFYAIPNNPNESIVVRLTEPVYIEQVGNYEGSICFDGVDDFVTIPTTVGGKQVFMKVNWNSLNHVLYDQRNNAEAPFCIVAASGTIAYNQRNVGGNTYIDGILNNHILVDDLQAITHNIVLNNDYNVANSNSFIGTNYTKSIYAQMALYDFMLFDEISTEAKIKELNEYVGVEAKVELPPYYWDAYGKTNSDTDKDTIQQRGVAVGDYDLTNTNFAYDKMSGFGGYTLGKFTNSWSLKNNSNSISIVARNPYDITLKKLGENSDWEFNTTELQIISNPVSVKFKSDKNIRIACDYHYYTVGENTEGKPLRIAYKDLIANEDTIITISPISQENIDKYNIDINRGYYLIYFQLSPTLAVNEEVTIEMLPLYPNGLVYDGVDDYSKNENIPVLTDYTIIAKRLWINKDNPLNEQFIHKGDINTPIGESAFMLEYEIANDTYYRSSSYGGYINIERSNRPERIVYQTSNSYNGTSITKGSGTDTTGIVIGGVTNNYWNGVFYKLMLYSKTLPLLQINYLKNLMERDEIIDLTNPIFIKEGKS